MFCGKSHTLSVDEDGLINWQNGMHIQNALPELTAEKRELLISGTCPICWDTHMKFDDDDEE